MDNISYQTLRIRIVNRIYVILGIISVPALVFSLYRYFNIGWQPLFLVDIIATILVILFAVFRKNLSYNVKVWALIAAFYTFGIADAVNLGLNGSLIENLMLCTFLGIIFLGKKRTLFIYAAGVLLILISAILHVEVFPGENPVVGTYSKVFSSWLSVLTYFSFVTGLLIIVAGEISHILSSRLSELEAKNMELQKANSEIQELQDILPICSRCKKIRDTEGYWKQVDTYISRHSGLQFSHSLCDTCSSELYNDQPWFHKPADPPGNS